MLSSFAQFLNTHECISSNAQFLPKSKVVKLLQFIKVKLRRVINAQLSSKITLFKLVQPSNAQSPNVSRGEGITMDSKVVTFLKA